MHVIKHTAEPGGRPAPGPAGASAARGYGRF